MARKRNDYEPDERVPAQSRWPANPRARLQRAKTDLDFVAAILGCGCDDLGDQLGRIHDRALRELRKAEREIKEGEGK